MHLPDKPTLTAEQETELRGRSNLMGSYLVLHAWAVIGLAMALFVRWPNPVTFIVAIVLIGGRQLGLAILMHDAAHSALRCQHHRTSGQPLGRSEVSDVQSRNVGDASVMRIGALAQAGVYNGL